MIWLQPITHNDTTRASVLLFSAAVLIFQMYGEAWGEAGIYPCVLHLVLALSIAFCQILLSASTIPDSYRISMSVLSF